MIEKRSPNKTKKSYVKRIIVIVGLFFLADFIWGLVSLDAWIYFFSGVAAFYIFSHLKKLKK